MTYKIDFSIATSEHIEEALCACLEDIRLSRNLTQAQLARDAGISLRTVGRMEKGLGVSLNTFIRVMRALRIQDNLRVLLPDASIRPMERVHHHGKERQRARPRKSPESNLPWHWGDELKK